MTDIQNTPEEKEEDFRPQVEQYCSRILSTNREADDLITEGFHIKALASNLRASLDRGATAFCIFVGKELAALVCCADNLRGKKIIDPRPFSIDFNNGEIVTGRAITIPKYRRLRLRKFSGFLLRQYYYYKGVRWIKGTMRANNVAVIASTFPDHYVTSRCKVIRIFGMFIKLKETKMEPTPLRQIYEQLYGHSKKNGKEESSGNHDQ
jgi:hypothetical protein